LAHGVIDEAAAGIPEAPPELHGVIAEYADADHVIAAAAKARRAGYRRMDAYSPFPVEGLDTALGFRDTLVPLIMLVGGACGALFGFGFLYFCMVVSYPLNVGGQPLYGWPTYIPITFECTVLFSALSGAIGMFMLNGLPQPYHPVFDAPNFDRATSSSFFLCIEAEPEGRNKGLFEIRDEDGVRYVGPAEPERFLTETEPVRVSVIERRK